MKVVGNCPQCGNPIYGDPSVQSVKRTCFCVTPARVAPLQVNPYVQPYSPWQPQPYYWWSNVATGANTTTLAIGNPPPDEDAGMVPK